MNKYYTFGEVADNMQFGEVAVKVDGLEDGYITHSNDTHDFVVTSVGTALYFDEKEGGMLKVLNRNKPISFFKDKDGYEERFVIMSREAYNSIKNT